MKYTVFLKQRFPFAQYPVSVEIAVDKGLIDCFMAQEQNHDDESLTPLGNASELFNLSDVWIGIVEWKPERDIQLILDYCRAYYSGESTL